MYMLWKFLKTSISQMYFLYLRSHNTIFLFFGQFCLKPIFLFFEASPTATLTSSRGIMSTDIITFIAIIITIIITDYWYHYFYYCFYYYSHYYDYFWYHMHYVGGLSKKKIFKAGFLSETDLEVAMGGVCVDVTSC